MADNIQGFILETLAGEMPRASSALFNLAASSGESSDVRVVRSVNIINSGFHIKTSQHFFCLVKNLGRFDHNGLRSVER